MVLNLSDIINNGAKIERAKVSKRQEPRSHKAMCYTNGHGRLVNIDTGSVNPCNPSSYGDGINLIGIYNGQDEAVLKVLAQEHKQRMKALKEVV